MLNLIRLRPFIVQAMPLGQRAAELLTPLLGTLLLTIEAIFAEDKILQYTSDLDQALA
jgi:hypothetical protein